MHSSTLVSPGSVEYLAVIGASAGGLEALSEFLSHLPEPMDKLAIVVAQHLSPHHPSQLVELLGHTTCWPVSEIQPDMPIVAGQVYVVPPQSEASFSGGSFQLQTSDEAIGPKPSVEQIFRSLALQSGLQSIAIVLSGAGKDGAQGLAPVKRAGGWVFAQTPEVAQHKGMPLAAIQTGHVDYVMTPAEMGQKIQQLMLESNQIAASDPDAATGDPFTTLLQLLVQRSDTDFTTYKPTTLKRRMQYRQTRLNLPDLAAYLTWVKRHPQELDTLFQTILIGVTGFFRDPEVFVRLESSLAQLLQSKGPGETLRIWVPGCSTGEEAYTFAIIIERLLQILQLNTPVQIFATDLDPQALAYARSASYSLKDLKHLPEELLEGCFKKTDDNYHLLKRIRDRVIFSPHDLTVHPPFLKMDLISCRNLLIYFGSGIQKSILPSFHSALNPEGLLVLGLSESVGATHGLFEPVQSELKIYRRSPEPIKAPVLAVPKVHIPATEMNWEQVSRDMLLEVMPQPCVLIGQSGELLQVTGDVSPFLSLAKALLKNQLLDICQPELKLELSSLMVQARHIGRTVSGAFRRVLDSSEFLRIHIHPGAQGQSLVVFEKVELPLAEPMTGDSADAQRIAELEQELSLKSTRMNALLEQLSFANQRQQVLNEELQSANEELQVANEELITSNEELQASIEEVQVAYRELDQTHQQLEKKEQLLLNIQAHLNALLENTAQAIVLIDKDYRILKYNHQAVSLHHRLYQRPLSEGRLIIDSFSNQSLPVLLPLIQQAIREGHAIQHEVRIEQTGHDTWLLYDLTPIMGPDQLPLSLVLSCQDITSKEEVRLALESSNSLIDSIFNATDVGLCLMDENGCMIKVNKGYCQIMAYAADEILGQHFSELCLPEQREQIIKHHETFNRLGQQPAQELRVRRKDGRLIDLVISAQLLCHPDGSRYKVLTIEDITSLKKDRALLLETQQMTGIGGWEMDLPSGEIRWTPEVYALYGQSPDQPIDLELGLQAYQPTSRARLEVALQRAMDLGEPFDLELEFSRQNDKRVSVRATAKATRQDGQTIRLNGTVQDISQRLQAEESLHKLSLVAQQIPNMVLITDADFRIEFANTAYQQETGYSLEALYLQNPLFLQGEKTDPATLMRIQKCLRLNQQVHAEILFYTCQTQAFWCDLVITPVLDKSGQPSCYIVLQTNITERKRREELLLFQSDILTHVSDAVVVCDLEGKISYWNKGAEQTYGHRMEEAYGLLISALDPDFDPQAFLALYQRGENPTQSRPEVQLWHKNGNRIWVILRMDVIYSAEGIPLGVISVSKDVTEKLRVETALRSSEETFRALTENSADGILVINAEGRADYVSSSTERMLGYTAESLKSQAFVDLIHPLDLPFVRAMFENLEARPGKSSTLEYRIRHSNESWIWTESILRNMRHDPHLKGIVCNFHDITQRKENEHQLHQDEQLYRSIAENFPRGMVMVLDHHLHCIFVEGQEMNSLIRRPLNQDYLEDFPMPSGEVLKTHLAQALLGKQQDFELALEEAWYAFSIVPLGDNRGRISRLLVVIQTITDAKRAVEDKNRMIQELLTKNEDLNQFTYIISHNLRAPVANLQGLTSLMLREDLIRPTGLGIFEHFNQTVIKLDDTILDLNRILSIRRHRDEVSKTVDLETELAWTLENLSIQYPEVSQWVHSELDAKTFFSVGPYIQSMLFNLISNAVKYRHPQRVPDIRLKSGRIGDHLWLELQDNGLGLDLASVQDKIFRLYMRFHPQIEGKGLGLYLLKTQAEALGGGVEVSSELGTGTRFHIHFKESVSTEVSP
jgi:PAS domain S-box-containing protein